MGGGGEKTADTTHVRVGWQGEDFPPSVPLKGLGLTGGSASRRNFEESCGKRRQTSECLLDYLTLLDQQALAGVAQLVERQPSKLNVEGSSPFARFKGTWLPCQVSFHMLIDGGSDSECLTHLRPVSRGPLGLAGRIQ